MEYAFNLCGAAKSVAIDIPIEKTLKVMKGQVVKISGGQAALSITSPFIGVAAEDHPGTPDMLNPRSNSDSIKIIASPYSVYRVPAPLKVTFKSGCTNVRGSIKETTLSSFTGAALKGARLICVEKADGSTNTDALGDIRVVTDFTTGDNTLTFSTGGVISEGDVYAFLPPVGFSNLGLNTSTFADVTINNLFTYFTVVSHEPESRSMLIRIN